MKISLKIFIFLSITFFDTFIGQMLCFHIMHKVHKLLIINEPAHITNAQYWQIEHIIIISLCCIIWHVQRIIHLKKMLIKILPWVLCVVALPVSASIRQMSTVLHHTDTAVSLVCCCSPRISQHQADEYCASSHRYCCKSCVFWLSLYQPASGRWVLFSITQINTNLSLPWHSYQLSTENIYPEKECCITYCRSGSIWFVLIQKEEI